MADVLTSIATTGGYSTTTVTKAYDLLFRKALSAQPQMRQMVDVRPERPTHRGDSVRLQIDPLFSAAQIAAAKTPLNEESDPDAVKMPATTYVDLTPQEYGFLTKRTLKLANRTMVPVDPAIAYAVADHCGKVIDELIQDQAETTTNKLYATGSTIAAQVATAALTANIVRRAVLKLRVAQSVPWDGQYYAAAIHPDAVFDLRTETGSGSWRVPNEYGQNQMRIWAGEIGEFEGVRFMENARTREGTDGASSAKVPRTYFFGKEALAEAVIVEPKLVVGPYTDAFERFKRVGWYGDLDFKVFRNESLVTVYTGTAA